MRLTVALRTPLAFWVRLSGDITERPSAPDTVAIQFEDWELVWHPPMDSDAGDLGVMHYGPMVSVVLETQSERSSAEDALQRFLSAVAFAYDQPVEDVTYEGTPASGELDPLNPYGARTERAYSWLYRADAPERVLVMDEPVLRLALALYREGLNSGSPFYRCLAFRAVLDAIHGVEHETRQGTPTPEALTRDQFIDSAASAIAGRSSMQTPTSGWSNYLRDEVRNAVAHVLRPGRRELNPDVPADRRTIARDGRLLQGLAREAIRRDWPRGVETIVRRL